ncbi:hypothetical protein AAFF_G00099630 [Aldrovandia affinis]|uniref:Uncharacterized protein n=1 Tax=Aldrovandia affinis TaxID=143900 RepID=A0AAD7RXJ6_9TELE|nr:hypothetical protein AAFF_G00099630 [Aldrovandia affinis]
MFLLPIQFPVKKQWWSLLRITFLQSLQKWRPFSRWEFLLVPGADADIQEHPDLTLSKTTVEKIW